MNLQHLPPTAAPRPPTATTAPYNEAANSFMGFMPPMYGQAFLPLQMQMQGVPLPPPAPKSAGMGADPFNKWVLDQPGNMCQVQPRLRRPYRFCTKCWMTGHSWVMRSVKLPEPASKSIFLNQHTNDRCPHWPDHRTPTAVEAKRYGAAFKQAQRNGTLDKLARECFRQFCPEITEEALTAHLNATPLPASSPSPPAKKKALKSDPSATPAPASSPSPPAETNALKSDPDATPAPDSSPSPPADNHQSTPVDNPSPPPVDDQ